MSIDSIVTLREIYGPAKVRSVKKQIDHLDRHCIRFISLSPFLVVASASATGAPDASPRGGVRSRSLSLSLFLSRIVLIAASPGVIV